MNHPALIGFVGDELARLQNQAHQQHQRDHLENLRIKEEEEEIFSNQEENGLDEALEIASLHIQVDDLQSQIGILQAEKEDLQMELQESRAELQTVSEASEAIAANYGDRLHEINVIGQHIYNNSFESLPQGNFYVFNNYELEVLAIVQAVKKFRIYLIGTKFKIITDCKAFTCTLAKKDLVTRIARWALLLEEFEYEVEHRQGTRMRHVDALSRNAAVFCVQAGQNLLNQLREAQGRDGKIKAIVELLNHGPYKDFVVHHGLLCKEIDGKLLYVVPDNMKTSLIRSIHQEGHFHHQKMKEKIEREFYMEDLKRRIENCISNCVECILSERKSGKPEGLLNVIPKGEVPLDTFHIDHLRPLTATKKRI